MHSSWFFPSSKYWWPYLKHKQIFCASFLKKKISVIPALWSLTLQNKKTSNSVSEKGKKNMLISMMNVCRKNMVCKMKKNNIETDSMALAFVCFTIRSITINQTEERD